MKLLSELKTRQLKEKDFSNAMDILDNELVMERVRDRKFLHDKFKEFPKFFIGIFLDKELVGVVCGFPREDYLLISEIAVDSRFQRRGFGKKLVEKFEQVAKNKYNKINVGAQDEAINFYDALNYKPFLLIQLIKQDYSLKDFKNFSSIKATSNAIEVKIKKPDINEIKKLRKKYPKAHFQYIFTKNI